MAKTTAVNQLQEQIDAIRREAFAQGYAAAMQAVRDLAARPAPGAGAAAPRGRPTTVHPAPAAAAPAGRRGRPRANAAPTAPAPRRGGRAAVPRPQRGTNARYVEEVLQSNAPRALRPAEIRSAIQRDKGVAMAFTSIRHALGQLEARDAAEQVGDSKTWRYTGATTSAD
ncbi:MAG TPA: hypothetical protein VME41_08385 [Stellaceae bacterium]|nr:hypothetical protein [Stellaceae bacterium]